MRTTASLIFTLSLTSFSAFAKENSCHQAMFKLLKIEKASPEQLDCAQKLPDFQTAAAALCTSKKPTVSKMFKAYLEKEKLYTDKLEEFKQRKATDPTFNVQLYAAELRQIETDWALYGYRSEVEMLKWSLERPLRENCAK